MVEWEPEPVTITADEALTALREDCTERSEREEAANWLRDYLTDGPQSAKQVRAAANEAGLAWITVRRAKDALGIRPAKTRFDGGWEWALPSKTLTSSQGAQLEDVSTFGPNEQLRKADGSLTGNSCAAKEYLRAKYGE